MTHNVRSMERYARLAAGVTAAYAATRTSGWKRSALCTVATAGIGTALAGYCPMNQALGRGEGDMADEWMRDTQLRRQMAMASALGSKPSGYAPMPPVTRQNDTFAGGQ